MGSFECIDCGMQDICFHEFHECHSVLGYSDAPIK